MRDRQVKKMRMPFESNAKVGPQTVFRASLGDGLKASLAAESNENMKEVVVTTGGGMPAKRWAGERMIGGARFLRSAAAGS